MIIIPLGLCVFGITYLLRYMEGPFRILKKIRIFFGIHYYPVHDENYNVVDEVEEIPSGNSWAKLFGCFWCLSTWISFGVCFLSSFVYKLSIIEWMVYSFACVGFAGFLHEKVVSND